jgi:hypothetical protein
LEVADADSSLMLTGARPEVTRDNMGHANIDVTQNVYGRSWWEERVEAVTRTFGGVFPPKWSPHWSPLTESFSLSNGKDWSGREDSNLRPPGPEILETA